MNFDFIVRNKGGHSSVPRQDNAIYELAAALKKIEALPDWGRACAIGSQVAVLVAGSTS